MTEVLRLDINVTTEDNDIQQLVSQIKPSWNIDDLVIEVQTVF